ncbi:competence protein CoiA [Halalkalibacter urbisdiaboli]|uniref:competence protein CoiA n=1 Tax=Halalkalibacter urbisdiaboli TaxID=1960589 RepID=UPI000B443308|nr:competence protein CoiA family protein [Halalkalibacter urbisdiaboli]
MLTAKTENGILISMAEPWNVDELKQLRKRVNFYCPACQASVRLKLGSKIQWHFAHEKDKACKIQLEAESAYHLSGKSQIYHWLKKQQVKVALEVYLPLIRQRPDLLIKHQKQLYAIEFQCSVISPELIEKRTNGYSQIGINPIWILGGTRLNRVGPYAFSIKAFEWLALRYTELNEKQLFFYCPNSTKWNILQQITPYSSVQSLGRLQEIPFDKFTLTQLFSPGESKPLPKDLWLVQKKHWRYNTPHLYPSKAQKYFQQLLYKKNIPLGHYPSEAGWPTRYYDYLETAPYLWQTILLLECLGSRPLHAPFSIRLLLNWIQPFIRRNIITLRKTQVSLEHTLEAYLFWLVSIDFLDYSLTDHQFYRKCELKVPVSLEDAQKKDENLMIIFNQKNVPVVIDE